MDMAFLLKTIASGVAIALMVAFAAWARIARPTPPLDEEQVRDLLAFEAPGAQIDLIWIAADRAGAVIRSADEALLVFRSGDGYITRATPWDHLARAAPRNGMIDLRLIDIGAPRARFRLHDGGAWPPAPCTPGLGAAA
jgi:hypothetical protein